MLPEGQQLEHPCLHLPGGELGRGSANGLDALLDLGLLPPSLQHPEGRDLLAPDLEGQLDLAFFGPVAQQVGRVRVPEAEEGITLFEGDVGSGKSTIALACLDSELVFVGDDHCLLATNPAPPYAYSLYNSAKVDADQIQGFPHLVSAISNAVHADTEKVLLFLHQHYPEKTAEGFPIRAIL